MSNFLTACCPNLALIILSIALFVNSNREPMAVTIWLENFHHIPKQTPLARSFAGVSTNSMSWGERQKLEALPHFPLHPDGAGGGAALQGIGGQDPCREYFHDEWLLDPNQGVCVLFRLNCERMILP